MWRALERGNSTLYNNKDLKGTSTTIETTLKLKTEIETLRA